MGVSSGPSSLSSVGAPLKSWHILIWIGIIGATAWFSQGWLQPDEHARVLEPAHMIAYGYASLPWELSSDHPIVSWFLGVIFSPLLMITRHLGWSGLSEAALIRFVVALVASTRFFAIWRIMSMMRLKESRQRFYMAVMLFGVFGPLFLVRTSQENIAATALVWALYLAFKMNEFGLSRGRAIFFGVLLALTASARPQAGLAAAGLGLWMLRKQGRSLLFPAALGVALGLVPMGVVDWWTTGTPFLPAWNYLHYALGDEGGGKIWGTSPWWFYIPQFIESWYPPLSILLVIPVLLGLLIVPELGAAVWPFAIVHFILGHKETRYFSPMIPFMQLAMFAGVESLERRSGFVAKITRAKGFWIRTVQFTALLTVIGGFLPMNSSPVMYDKLGKLLRSGEMTSFTYVGNTTSGFSQFYAKVPDPPNFEQVSWNDVRDGVESPSGWLVFYALDPADFLQVLKICQSETPHSYSKWAIDLLLLTPRSPARRRLNPILYCPTPLDLNDSKSIIGVSE